MSDDSEQAEVSRLKDQVLDYIRRTEHVSFAELSNHFRNSPGHRLDGGY
jgi:hypothetical protein